MAAFARCSTKPAVPISTSFQPFRRARRTAPEDRQEATSILSFRTFWQRPETGRSGEAARPPCSEAGNRKTAVFPGLSRQLTPGQRNVGAGDRIDHGLKRITCRSLLWSDQRSRLQTPIGPSFMAKTANNRRSTITISRSPALNAPSRHSASPRRLESRLSRF